MYVITVKGEAHEYPTFEAASQVASDIFDATSVIVGIEEKSATLVAREFPDFHDVLPVLEGFVDSSYHHDVCPSLTNDELGLQLFVDYPDPDDSEYAESRRNGAVGRYRLLTLEGDLVANTDYLEEVVESLQAATHAPK